MLCVISALAALPAMVSPPLFENNGAYTDLGAVTLTLPDGTPTQARRVALTHPLCVSGPGIAPGMGQDQSVTLQDLIERREATGERRSVVARTDRAGGLNIIWNVFGMTSPEAEAGLLEASEYFAGLIEDDITIEINVTFDRAFYGASGSYALITDYETIRQALVADADADDTIQDLLLPDAFPSRWTFLGPIAFNTELAITTANARGLGLTFDNEGQVDTEMFIGATLDFDASDGIGSPSEFSGVDIIIHQVGHAIGFVSAIQADLDPPLAAPLDLFRFAETGPDNPETELEFTIWPRAFYTGGESPDEQHQLDLLRTETPLANGSGYTASHWRPTVDVPRPGAMDPTLTPFLTLFPDYMSAADIDAFDAIGWDVTAACSVADLAQPLGELNFDDVIGFLTAFEAMDDAADLALPTGVLNFDDVLAFLVAFGAGCP